MMKDRVRIKSEKKLKREMKLLEAIGLLDDAMIEDAMIEGPTIEDTRTAGVTIENAMTKGAARLVAAVAAIAACFIIAIPVFAREIPTIYRIIDRYAPTLADYIMPDELMDEKEGVRMQVEAVRIEGEDASLVVSFSDLPGYDRISGKVDLYDSYNLSSFGTDTSIGGCSFLEYNEQEDKAYFLIDIMGDGKYEKEKIQFTVCTLLTRVSALEQDIPLTEISNDPVLKEVEISGSGGGVRGRELCSKLINGRLATVIAISELIDMDGLDRDDLSVTGIAYADGILHVQSCRGSEEDAERHLQLKLFLDGQEYEDGMGVCWREVVNGEELIFDEEWYAVSPEELAKSHLLGIFHIADSPVQGDWKVITRIQ